MSNKALLLLVCVLLSSSSRANEILFILPDYKHHSFWELVKDVTISVAKEQSLSVNIVHTENNRFSISQVIDEVLSRQHKPNYVVFRPFQGSTKHIFDQLESHQIHFVTLEKVLLGEELRTVGEPGEKYKYWLGEINYLQQQASYNLTKALYRIYLGKTKNTNIQITGLGGSYDAMANARQQGLIQFTEKQNEINLTQIFNLFFSQKLLNQRFDKIMKRYPQTNVFWNASAQMAIATSKQRENYPELSKNWVIGGIDFLPEALNLLQQDKINAIVGGHFLMGANALITVIEHQRGIVKPRQYEFELLTKSNVDNYLLFMESRLWRKVGFSRFIANSTQSKVPPLNIKSMIETLSHEHAMGVANSEE